MSSILKFRSKFEQTFARWLDEKGIDYQYEPVAIPYYSPVPKGKCDDCGGRRVARERSYTPDFYLPRQDIWVETKGRFLARDRAKILRVLASGSERREQPTLCAEKFYIVFMQNHTIKLKGAQDYAQWCEKHEVNYGFFKKDGLVDKEGEAVDFPPSS